MSLDSHGVDFLENRMDRFKSKKHHRGLLDELLHFGQELCGDSSIDHAMVGREAEVHAQARNDLAVLDDRLFDRGTD